MAFANKLPRVGSWLEPYGYGTPCELFKKSDLTDITLVVEGKELHFVKYLLMEGSSVFAKMIKSSADPSRLIIDDLTYQDMIMFLKCLHPKCVMAITDVKEYGVFPRIVCGNFILVNSKVGSKQNVFIIFYFINKEKDTTLEAVATIAHTFQYEKIIGICEQYITLQLNQVTTTINRMYPNFFLHLKVAEKLGLKKAIEVGVSSKQVELAYFGRHKGSGVFDYGYQNDPNFLQLSWETKFSIVSRRLKETEKWTPPVKADLPNQEIKRKKHF